MKKRHTKSPNKGRGKRKRTEDTAIIATRPSTVIRPGKPCPLCHRFRVASEFNKSCRDGMDSACRDCQRNKRAGLRLYSVRCLCCSDLSVPGFRLCAACSQAATRLAKGGLIRLKAGVDYPIDAATIRKPGDIRVDED